MRCLDTSDVSEWVLHAVQNPARVKGFSLVSEIHRHRSRDPGSVGTDAALSDIAAFCRAGSIHEHHQDRTRTSSGLRDFHGHDS